MTDVNKILDKTVKAVEVLDTLMVLASNVGKSVDKEFPESSLTAMGLITSLVREGRDPTPEETEQVNEAIRELTKELEL